MMKSISEAQNLKAKKVLVRVDWNVPLDGKQVLNDFRIKASMPTLEFLQEAGAMVSIATHLEKGSMDALKQYVPEGMKLLPNLRENAGEVDNDQTFAKELAEGFDIYVNEAFSVSHREHASIVSVPKLLESYAGMRLTREVEELSKAFYPKHPFLFILGGAKFTTKLPLLQKFINLADHIFIGGAMANNFFKERGEDVGDSLVSEGDYGIKELMASGKILLPTDKIIQDNKILDVGPQSLEMLREHINSSKMILWSGPLGFYEMGFKVSSQELARMIAESGNESIIGGGDTLASIEELNILDKFSFVSTGGGAMLDFLANGTLPGIEALGK